MAYLIDLFLHLDVHLAEFVAQYGVLVYAGLFAIIFAETGLVVTPFLPGDSLLFAAGALAAAGAKMPDGVQLRVVEDTDTVKHLVLPAAPGEGEIAEEDLERVSGGTCACCTMILCNGQSPS